MNLGSHHHQILFLCAFSQNLGFFFFLVFTGNIGLVGVYLHATLSEKLYLLQFTFQGLIFYLEPTDFFINIKYISLEFLIFLLEISVVFQDFFSCGALHKYLNPVN